MDKVIVISGGSVGLGLSFAKVLSEDNNKVIVLSRTKEDLEKVSREHNCEYKVCDIRNFNEVEEVISKIGEEYGKIDILINNAGIWLDGDLEDNPYEKIQDVINTNLVGQIFLTKASLPFLKQSGKGLIVNTNSRAGKRVRDEISVYNAAKWGFRGFSSALKDSLQKDNVSTIDLFPAGIDTELFKRGNSPRDQSKYLDPDVMAQVLKNSIDVYFKYDTVLAEIDFKHLD